MRWASWASRRPSGCEDGRHGLSILGESLARAGKALARGFRLSYDYLGMVLVGSSLYFVVGLAPAIVTLTAALQVPSLLTLLPFLGTVVFLTLPGFTALLAVSRQLVEGEDVPALRGLWRAFRTHFVKAAGLAGAECLILLILVADLLFFLQAGSPVVRALAGMWVWLLIFALTVTIWAPAVMVWLGKGVWYALRQSALIVLDNLVVTWIVVAVLAVLGIVSTVLGAPLLLLFGGMSAFLVTAAMEAILDRYRSLQADGKAGEQR